MRAALKKGQELAMTQTSNRFYDRFAQLMNDAASVAQGVRKEASTMFKSQAERVANDMDLVKREDFDAIKDMAQKAREENGKLEERIAALEAKLGIKPPAKTAPKSGTTAKSGSSAGTTKKASTSGRSTRSTSSRAKSTGSRSTTAKSGTSASKTGGGRGTGRSRSTSSSGGTAGSNGSSS